MKAKLLTAQKRANRAPRERHEKDIIQASQTQEGSRRASRPSFPGGSGGRRSLRQAAVQPQQDPGLQAVAADYNQKHGLKPPTHTGYAEVNLDQAKKVADAYEALQHNPDDPKVKKAYAALLRQTKQQWDHAKNAGYKLEPWSQEGQPYYSSKEMMDDVRNNKHLWYFTGGDMPTGHPLAGTDPETGEVYNNMFRGIHDLYGHAKGGYEFGPRGEENAYLTHRDMFDKDAIPALTTETKGQNSWVNYGRHMRNEKGEIPKKGEPGYIHPAERPYADQKAGLLHDE